MSGRRIFYPYPQHPPIETEREHVPVAQLDRALDSDSKGQRFESSRVRHVAVDSAIPIPQENLRDFPCSVTAPLPQKVTLASSEPLLARVLIADSLATNFLRFAQTRFLRLFFSANSADALFIAPKISITPLFPILPAPLPQKVTLASSEPLLARVLIADSLATNFLRFAQTRFLRLFFSANSADALFIAPKISITPLFPILPAPLPQKVTLASSEPLLARVLIADSLATNFLRFAQTRFLRLFFSANSADALFIAPKISITPLFPILPAPLPQKVTLASSEPLLARVLIADSLATNFLRLRLWMSSRLTFFHMDGTRRV